MPLNCPIKLLTKNFLICHATDGFSKSVPLLSTASKFGSHSWSLQTNYDCHKFSPYLQCHRLSQPQMVPQNCACMYFSHLIATYMHLHGKSQNHKENCRNLEFITRNDDLASFYKYFKLQLCNNSMTLSSCQDM